MKAFKGEFIKKDGSVREMSFVKLKDIGKTNPEFLSNRISGDGLTREYPDGQELVYDLIADNFRIFNHATKVTELEMFEVDDSIFLEQFIVKENLMMFILEDLVNGETRLSLEEMELEKKQLKNIVNGFLPNQN